MPASRQAQSDLLRTVYQPWLRRSFNVDSVISHSFERKEKTLALGEQLSFPLHTQGGSTYQWTTANKLPAPDAQVYDRATFTYRMMTNRIQIAGDFIQDAKGGKTSEAKPVDAEMRGLLVDIRHGLNFDFFGNGTALQATAAGATSSTVMTVDSVRGLRNNMRVDIIKKADGTVGGGASEVRILIDAATLTITLQDGAALADFNEVNSNASDYGIYRHDSRNKAIFGLDAIISTSNPAAGNYGNIDRTAAGTDYWKGKHHHNSGTPRNVSDTIMQDMVDDIDTTSNCRTNLIVTTHDIWSSIANGRVSLKRYNGNMLRSDGWWQALDWAGIPIVRDKHCQPGRMYFLDTNSFWICQDSEGKWMDDGSVLSRVDGYVAYEAAWHRQLQMVCLQPNGNGKVDDLQ